jgi:anti-sigma B factor antagonist
MRLENDSSVNQTELEELSGIRILRWKDNISLKNEEEFRKAIELLTESGSPKLLLDLSPIQYMNSSALGIIAKSALEGKSRGQELIVGGLQESMLDIFSMVRFSTIVTLYTKLEDALAHYTLSNRGEES